MKKRKEKILERNKRKNGFNFQAIKEKIRIEKDDKKHYLVYIQTRIRLNKRVKNERRKAVDLKNQN